VYSFRVEVDSSILLQAHMSLVHELAGGLMLFAEISDAEQNIRTAVPVVSTAIAAITLYFRSQELASKGDLTNLASKDDLKAVETKLEAVETKLEGVYTKLDLVGHVVMMTADEMNEQRTQKEILDSEKRKERTDFLNALRKDLRKDYKR
jgi:hypothetical protein